MSAILGANELAVEISCIIAMRWSDR